MAEERKTSTHYAPVWGVFLLFLGIVFLLQTLNVISWDLWGKLWRFWPVLLIAIGLSILLRHYHPWLVSAVIFVLFLACLGIAFWQYEAPPSWQITNQYTEPRGNLENAEVKIDFDAGKLVINSLPMNDTDFIEAKGNRDIRITFDRLNQTGSLHLTTGQVKRQFYEETRWEAGFSPQIPIFLEITSAVGNLDLDLSQLQVSRLQMDIDAGNCIMTMPAFGTVRAEIKADIANLEITIPEGVAARIKTETDLATVAIDESRFPGENGDYVSPAYSNAANRLELEINCDIGRVVVK
ncbi:LiaI-LiaF-like domain-containing protein [Chloroflexota bacterium]